MEEIVATRLPGEGYRLEELPDLEAVRKIWPGFDVNQYLAQVPIAHPEEPEPEKAVEKPPKKPTKKPVRKSAPAPAHDHEQVVSAKAVPKPRSQKGHES